MSILSRAITVAVLSFPKTFVCRFLRGLNTNPGADDDERVALVGWMTLRLLLPRRSWCRGEEDDKLVVVLRTLTLRALLILRLLRLEGLLLIRLEGLQLDLRAVDVNVSASARRSNIEELRRLLLLLLDDDDDDGFGALMGGRALLLVLRSFIARVTMSILLRVSSVKDDSGGDTNIDDDGNGDVVVGPSIEDGDNDDEDGGVPVVVVGVDVIGGVMNDVGGSSSIEIGCC